MIDRQYFTSLGRVYYLMNLLVYLETNTYIQFIVFMFVNVTADNMFKMRMFRWK